MIKQMKSTKINFMNQQNNKLNKHLSVITLNINGLNIPIKIQTRGLNKKTGSIIFWLQETYFTIKDRDFGDFEGKKWNQESNRGFYYNTQ